MTTVNENYFSTFLDAAIEDVDEQMFEDMSYQGFDPSVIRREIAKRGWTGAELTQLIVFFIMRGTNMKKAETKSTEKCVKLLKGLRAKGLTENRKGPTNITINRVICALPEVVAGVIAKYPKMCRILCKTYGNLPLYLKFSAGASLCKNVDELQQWIVWATEQDAIINSGEGRKPDPDSVVNYANIQYNGSVIPDNKIKTIRDKLDRILLENQDEDDNSAGDQEEKKKADKGSE